MSHILAFTIGVIVGINLTIILAMLYAERRER